MISQTNLTLGGIRVGAYPEPLIKSWRNVDIGSQLAVSPFLRKISSKYVATFVSKMGNLN